MAFLFLALGLLFGQKMMDVAEAGLFPDTVIYATSTPYQRIVITKAPHDLRLFLNNNLQFSSRDEYRYHEALVHPGLAAVPNPRRVLILGGGDGLALREILKYPSIEEITMVDHDHALDSPKLRIINADAFPWLRDHAEEVRRHPYDFVVVDFPDPSNYAIGKLYSLTFFKLLRDAIAEYGRIVVQSTSPYIAQKAFSCVIHTLDAAGMKTTPYHVFVPSFGEWGFVLAGKTAFTVAATYPPGLKFIRGDTVASMLHFPMDMEPKPLLMEINRLDNQALVRYFDEEWSAYGINN
jgi:spermidine synthase